MRTWIGALVLLAGCAPPEAPTELSELSRFLFAEWDADDARLREEGLKNLEDFLANVDLDAKSIDDRAWELTDLQPDDVDTITRPDRPLEDCLGIGMGYHSTWPVVDHARLQAEADQTTVESTAPRYERTFTNVDDSACFPDKSCDVLETSNDMRRENLLLAADSILLKNFRWTPFEDDDGNAHDAFYSRSWYAESWPGDDGKVMLWQSYSIDVWIDRGDGTSWRYQTLWNETDLGVDVSDGLFLGTIKGGTQGTFENGDEAIGTLYHPEE